MPPLEAYAGPRLTVSTPQEGPVQELHELVPGVDHETVEGTSHWIQLDDPDRFNEILDRSSRRVDRADDSPDARRRRRRPEPPESTKPPAR